MHYNGQEDLVVPALIQCAPGSHIRHQFLQLLAPFSDMIEWVVDHLGIGEFLPSNWLMDLIADMACPEGSFLEVVCENVVFILAGYDK